MDATALQPVINLGIAGVALIVLARYARSAIDRERATTDLERARADRAETALAEVHRSVREDVVPVLVRTAEAMTRMTTAVEDLLRRQA